MKKLFILCLVVAMALSMLCSAVAEQGPSGSITYMCWGSTVERDIVEEICKSYMETHPGTTIELQYVPSEYDTKVTTLVAAGNEPDVAYMNPPLAYSLAENGKLVNIRDLAEQDESFSFDDYVPGVWFASDDDNVIGRRIGIAAYCLYYNVDALEAAGLEPYSTDWKNPMDWDTFVANCKALTIDRNGLHPDDEGFDPENIEQYGFSLTKDRVPVLLAASGIKWTDEEGKKFTIASEEGIDALQKFADLIHVHHVSPTPVQSEGLPGASVSLTSGMVASTLDGNWMCADFAAAGANFNMGVLPSIYPEKYSAFEDCGPVVIFKSCENLELAWDFYKYAIDLSNNDTFYTAGISIPVLKDWLSDADKLAQWTENDTHPSGYVGSLLTPLVESPITSAPSDYVRNFTQQKDLFDAALDRIFSGTATAEEAIMEVAPQIEALMQGAYSFGF